MFFSDSPLDKMDTFAYPFGVYLGLTNRTDIINYLIILGKLCIWECRKAGIYPDFNIFLKKVKIK